MKTPQENLEIFWRKLLKSVFGKVFETNIKYIESDDQYISFLRSSDLTSIQKSCQVALAAYPINILNIFYPMIIRCDDYSESMFSSRPGSFHIDIYIFTLY